MNREFENMRFIQRIRKLIVVFAAVMMAVCVMFPGVYAKESSGDEETDNITGYAVNIEGEADLQAAGSSSFALPVKVKFSQTEARKELDMINAFRTGSDAWYWNQNDTEKIYVNNLSELKYDYDLEKVAMQRAAEIAVYYSHTRPDDSICWQTYADLGYVYRTAGENIAAGQTTAAEVIEDWKEENFGYTGQGHRRNMLSSSFTAVGVGCVYYEGYYYWTQEFSGSPVNTTKTSANDSYSVRSVMVNSSYIYSWEQDKTTLEINEGESYQITDLMKIKYMLNKNGWTCQKVMRESMYVPDWKPEDSSVVSYKSGVLSGLKEGTTKMNAQMPDGSTLSVTVKVIRIHHWTDPVYTWSDDNSTVSAETICTDCDEVISETVNTTYTVTKEPSCEKEGIGVYEAVFTNEILGSSSKAVLIPAGSHSYMFDGWQWLNDFEEAYAVFVCEHDDNHVLKISADILMEETDDAYIYTASAEFEGNTYTDTKNVTRGTRPNFIKAFPGEWALTYNQQVGCTAVVYPGSAEDRSVTWSSENDNIATVDQKGFVLATGVGRTTITAATFNGLMSPIAITVQFNDVMYSERYYYDPVYWAVDNKITVGTSPLLFSPDEKVTRGQIVTFLYRAAGEPAVEGTMPFTDVSASRYYYNAVLWAKNNNITTGTSPTKFSPNDKCTRAQIVTFLWRYMLSPEPENMSDFEDVVAGSFYEKAVSWAAETGVTTGTSATKFSPNDTCTRGQAVTFLYRAVAED